uniref:Uncharacterized protein n=1 Tax=Mycena chlorophos TaxID=658473 RepID=A0ABQ0M4H5_MYCCL|nr:predicted protein [Mycena chlorophos]
MSPAGTSSTSPSSLNSHELDYHEALYGLVLECLEDAAKKPDLSEAEKAQLEEQCAQTRARIATVRSTSFRIQPPLMLGSSTVCAVRLSSVLVLLPRRSCLVVAAMKEENCKYKHAEPNLLVPPKDKNV